ncbi:MAG: YvrJ family protein [Bacillota bacterium]|nr:YvrJ family protein [Bacillota bacterium]
MEELLIQIANYGFPMVISVYLLVRVETKLEALTTAILKLNQVMETKW